MDSSSAARFRQAPKGQSDVVRLQFPQTSNQESLYAPGSVLGLWSGVLRNALEDTAAATAPAQQKPANQEYDYAMPSLPLDDTDTAAWEDALRLMYPTVPLFQVTFDNASRLLLLADKYDMPCISEHVKLFLTAQEGGTSRLQQHLTEENVFAWLRITSMVGLEDSAKQCITYIFSNNLPLPQGYISSVQPEVLQQLFNAQQVQNKSLALDLTAVTQQHSRMEYELKSLRERMDDLEGAAPRDRGSCCIQCRYALFKKPNGKAAQGGGIYCLNCGASNNP